MGIRFTDFLIIDEILVRINFSLLVDFEWIDIYLSINEIEMT